MGGDGAEEAVQSRKERELGWQGEEDLCVDAWMGRVKDRARGRNRHYFDDTKAI